MKLFIFKTDLNKHFIRKFIDHFGMDYNITGKVLAEKSAYILSGDIYEQFYDDFDSKLHFVFVFAIQSTSTLKKQLGLKECNISKIHIIKDYDGITGYLSGLHLEGKRSISVFENISHYEILLTADDYPIVIKNGHHILSSVSFIDIDNEVTGFNDPVEIYLAEIVPVVLFIKYYFGPQAWTLKEKVACLTIDDPVLKKDYGYISFKKFTDWICKNNFAATFAFIPWNYRRSNLEVIDLFIKNASKLSICIHGCDHTKMEYSNENSIELSRLTEIALNRMDNHEDLTGMSYDKIMIFPQGKFSCEAIDILPELGFVSIVNSTVFPTNYKGGYTIKDFISPTIKTRSGIHIIRRRYPKEIIGFALDLLFERPLIVVQHHQDFKNGYTYLTSFFNQIMGLDSKIKWKPLGTLVDDCCWYKNSNSIQEFKYIKNFIDLKERGSLIAATNIFYNFKVLLRRWLSELRDNFIH